MPDSSLLQSPRNRFVAFSAVGVAMVCLPLWQVLHYQQSELTQLAAERALLDPVARAVHVQFGLLAHRQVAAQLLQGQPQLEPARLAVQAGVDGHLMALSLDLAQGLWSHALAETRDLTRDWHVLAGQVKARALSPSQSEHAHALRIEQAVQVVDLVTLAEAVSEAGADSARLLAAARALSRLAIDMPTPAAALQPDGEPLAAQLSAEPVAVQPAVELVQARLRARLAALELALAEPASLRGLAVGPVSAAGALRPALAEVDRTTRQLLLLQPGTGTVATGDTPALRAQRANAWHTAWHTAHTAQLQLFKQAVAQHKRALAQRQSRLQRQQTAWLAALALLSAAALALASVLSRQLSRSPDPARPQPRGRAAPEPTAQGARRQEADGAAWAGPVAGQAASQTRVEAVQLLDRMRTGAPEAGPQRQAGRLEPQDTLPPERG